MRDMSEHAVMNNSRAKFKQRIAGGAVLLIVLAIFLPFIFSHAHWDSSTPQSLAAETQPEATLSAAPEARRLLNQQRLLLRFLQFLKFLSRQWLHLHNQWNRHNSRNRFLRNRSKRYLNRRLVTGLCKWEVSLSRLTPSY